MILTETLTQAEAPFWSMFLRELPPSLHSSSYSALKLDGLAVHRRHRCHSRGIFIIYLYSFVCTIFPN